QFYSSLVKYSGTLAFFLPLAFSLNNIELSVRHFILLLLLVSPVILSAGYANNYFTPKKEEVLFALLSVVFLVVLLLFVKYSPIRDEFSTRVEIKDVIFKSLYLLTVFFLIYMNFRLLEMVRHSSFSFIKKPDIIVSVFIIIIVSLSLYDNISLKKSAEGCLHRGYKECRTGVGKISDMLYKKGLNNQNIIFLSSMIKSGMDSYEPDIINVIEKAERMYPYRCDFFAARILYYKKFGFGERITEVLKNIPAPVKRVCNNTIYEGIDNAR
ncbi:MAG: hypothetical protein N3B13_07130, partial [Deltaproteobacteria bacterium]|nr:hypothetical protein [Deltaproteobacteria bacterium]